MSDTRLDLNVFNKTYISLRARRDKLSEELGEIETKLTAFKTVIEECAERANGSARVPQIGMTSRAMLQGVIEKIAKRQNGIINLYSDKEKLVATGAVRGDPKAVSYRINDALRSSERFERGETRGEWRLVNYHPC